MSFKLKISKKQFQETAYILKKEKNISLCKANELLAKTYGYKDYGSIKKDFVDEVNTSEPQALKHEDFYRLEEERIFAYASKINNYFKPYHKFDIQRTIDGIAYNPNLPSNFRSTPNEERDLEELENWWNRAYIVSNLDGNNKLKYYVYCLDGGAWDRPTLKGHYEDFELALQKAQEINNITPTHNRYKTLSNGLVVNTSGLFIDSKGFRNDGSESTNDFKREEVVKALLFINTVLEKRKTINKTVGTSYSLKNRAEELLTHYFPNIDYYISNGAFIAALDEAGYQIREINKDGFIGINIYTNIKKIDEFTINLYKENYQFDKDKFLEEYDSVISR